MLRNIVGAVVGYVAMVAIVILSLFVTWSVLGAQGSFAGDGPYPSTTWTLSNIVFGFVAAFLGGWLAHKIGQTRLAVYILIGAILALGLYAAITAESSYEKRVARAGIDKPVAELTFFEAGAVAKNPAWYVWTIPLIGAVGACLGGRSKKEA